MNEEKTSEPKAAEGSTEKPGFFQRIFTKLDQSMKEQADAKAQNNCCGESDGKGGKCC
ncbi:MAG: hypothetical protein AAF065_03225 [Verrucomicrobiota bacterium]